MPAPQFPDVPSGTTPGSELSEPETPRILLYNNLGIWGVIPKNASVVVFPTT